MLCGIPGSGKSRFLRERLFDSHVRIARSLLETPQRERVLLRACVDTLQPFVVDEVNATAADRRPFVEAATAAGYRIVGYWFEPREGIDPPTLEEGFDEVHRVTLTDDGFEVADAAPAGSSRSG